MPPHGVGGGYWGIQLTGALKKRKQWSEEAMVAALDAVKEGESVLRASRYTKADPSRSDL